MWHYLYRVADGVLLSESDQAIDAADGCAVASFDARQGQGGTQWDAATHAFVSAPGPRQLVPTTFIDRFTMPERIAVRELAKTDTIVDDYLQRLNLKAACNESVDLDSVNTIGGLAYLETAGVLAAGRKEQIRA